MFWVLDQEYIGTPTVRRFAEVMGQLLWPMKFGARTPFEFAIDEFIEAIRALLGCLGVILLPFQSAAHFRSIDKAVGFVLI